MIISIVGVCGFRLAWIFTLFQIPAFHSLPWLFASYIISWSFSFVAGLIVYLVKQKRLCPKEL